jgi:hypothetical protein
MAGQLSNKGEEIALNAVFRGGSSVYLGLSTSAITDTTLLSGVTEPTDSSYARKVITFGAPTQVSNVTTVQNDVAIDYTAWVTNAPAKFTYAFITTAQTGTTGDILAWFALDVANQIQPLAGQPVKVPIGGISVTME